MKLKPLKNRTLNNLLREVRPTFGFILFFNCILNFFAVGISLTLTFFLFRWRGGRREGEGGRGRGRRGRGGRGGRGGS